MTRNYAKNAFVPWPWEGHNSIYNMIDKVVKLYNDPLLLSRRVTQHRGFNSWHCWGDR